MTRRPLVVLAGVAALLAGCGHAPAPTATTAPAPFQVSFSDVTAAMGLDFVHTNGAFGQKWMPETMGSGVAWLDYDGDGWPDLLFVNSREWTAAERRLGKAPPPTGARRPATLRLYRNLEGQRFEDVTAAAGLAVEMYGMGACAGDYDNDGHIDVLVTALERNFLFRNEGDGTFTEVAQRAGVAGSGWGTSCTFVDVDRDGHLDVFVAHYVDWSPDTDIFCEMDGQTKSYCTPENYPGERCRLYRNRGNGTFEDISDAAGILTDERGRALQGKSLGVVLCDYNGDGWPDLVVANDTEPTYLFENRGDGKFAEVGVQTGVAFGESGRPRAGMGIDIADYNRTGRDSIAIGNFSRETVALYTNQRNIFIDKSLQTELGRNTLLSLTFGCFFFDADNDGWLDLLAANGHIDPEVEHVQSNVTFRQRPQLFRNTGGGFVEVTGEAGPGFQRALLARGAAYADFDRDGFLDIVITTNGGRPVLLRNSGGSGHGSVRVTLRGSRSNRSAIGAVVEATVAGQTQRYTVRGGASYLSQSELPLTIGLGGSAVIERLVVHWPSGGEAAFDDLPAGQAVLIEEPDRLTQETANSPPDT